MITKESGYSFRDDENVLELDSGGVTRFCEYTKKQLNCILLREFIFWYVNYISIFKMYLIHMEGSAWC